MSMVYYILLENLIYYTIDAEFWIEVANLHWVMLKFQCKFVYFFGCFFIDNYRFSSRQNPFDFKM